MFQVLRTDEFDTWLHGLRDIARAQAMVQLLKE